MRNPNGFGTVKKLSGNRRRPYAAMVTTGYGWNNGARDISFLRDALGESLYNDVLERYNNYCDEVAAGNQTATQKQKAIGYYATRAEALTALAEYHKQPLDMDKQKITFAQVYSEVHAAVISKKKKTTAYIYEAAYSHCSALHGMQIRKIKTAHLQAVLDSYSDSSATLLNNIVILYHMIFNYAIEHDIIYKDYSRFVTARSTQAKKDKRALTADEVRALWNQQGDYAADCILILLYTGMRIGELYAVTADEIHISDKYIDLQNAGTKTKAAARLVPLHDDIIPVVNRLLKNGFKTETYINFRNRTANKLKQIAPDQTPHVTRHTFITRAADAGVDPITVKKIVGHTAHDVTADIYTHTDIAQLIQAVNTVKFL